MKNIRLLVGVGSAQFGILIWRRFMPQITLWGMTYTAHAGKISQSIAVLVVPERSAGQANLSASVGKGGIAVFASRASVTPFCGVLGV